MSARLIAWDDTDMLPDEYPQRKFYCCLIGFKIQKTENKKRFSSTFHIKMSPNICINDKIEIGEKNSSWP